MKIYKKGNYILIVDGLDKQIEDFASNVMITKNLVTDTTYNVSGKTFNTIRDIALASILKEDGSPYATALEWETFYLESTGFNAVGGGSSALNLKANIASPTLTGVPASTTATAGTNTTQIATTAFVSVAIANLVGSSPATLDTLNELATALGSDANFATTTANSIGTKLSKAGDTITGDMANSATGFFTNPSGTTAQRPVSPLNGMTRYNTTTLRNEYYSNGAWRNHARLEGDTFTGLVNLSAGANIASASTVNLTVATGNNLTITGTTTITAFTMTAGQNMYLIMGGICQLTYNATTMNLNGGANYTTAVGDRLTVFRDLAGVVQVNITRQSGLSLSTEERLGSNIASASTTTIGTIGIGNTINITGSTTINSFGVSTTGFKRKLVFNSSLIVNHNATSLICINDGNMQISTEDILEFLCINGALGYWKCVGYQSKLLPRRSASDEFFVDPTSGITTTAVDSAYTTERVFFAKRSILANGTVTLNSSTGVMTLAQGGQYKITVRMRLVYAPVQTYTMSLKNITTGVTLVSQVHNYSTAQGTDGYRDVEMYFEGYLSFGDRIALEQPGGWNATSYNYIATNFSAQTVAWQNNEARKQMYINFAL